MSECIVSLLVLDELNGQLFGQSGVQTNIFPLPAGGEAWLKMEISFISATLM
jgi:hypothetical protein